MPNVVISDLIIQKIDLLFDALLEDDYFSDPVNADDYCIKLFDFIDNIPQEKRRLTKNEEWGVYYATHKANRRTTRYFTFDVENNAYIIRNIINNHTSDYPTFIASIK